MTLSADILIKTLQSKRYKIFGYGLSGSAYDMNLIAVSSDKPITDNTFNDSLCLLYKDKSNSNDWVLDIFQCTTAPGLWEINNPSFPAAQKDGVCVIAEGQYPKSFILGHHGLGNWKHEALIQIGGLDYYRYKKEYGDPMEYREVGKRQNYQLFSTNIHRAATGTLTRTVDNWSAGCIVLADDRGPYHKFISLCKKQQAVGLGSVFTLTVLKESELWQV